MHTTLIRDQIGQGLGFSIAGGRGSPPYKDGCDGIFISRITEGGLAHRDGKITVGDRVMAVSMVPPKCKYKCRIYFHVHSMVEKKVSYFMY